MKDWTSNKIQSNGNADSIPHEKKLTFADTNIMNNQIANIIKAGKETPTQIPTNPITNNTTNELNVINPLQVSQGISAFSHSANFYKDTGTANAYILQPANDFNTQDHNGDTHTALSMPTPATLLDGMEVRFRPLNINTGASTITIKYNGLVFDTNTQKHVKTLITLTTKNIKLSDGTTNITAGTLDPANDCILRYDLANDCFIVVLSKTNTTPISMRAVRTTTQSLTSGVITKVAYNAVENDISNFYNTTNNRFVFQDNSLRFTVNGSMIINASITFDIYVYYKIYHSNGTTIKDSGAFANTRANPVGTSALNFGFDILSSEVVKNGYLEIFVLVGLGAVGNSCSISSNTSISFNQLL